MPSGLDIDIISAILDELECEYNFIEIPAKRAQVLLKRGALDIMPAASITQERQSYSYFSEPYRDEAIAMFVRSESLSKYQYYVLRDAIDNGLRITAGLGAWYGPEYNEEKARAIEIGALTLNASTAVRFQQLFDLRTDMVLADLFVGYHYAIKSNRLDDFSPLPHLLNSDPAHFMLSKSSIPREFVSEFNNALELVLSSEKYERLLEKYRPTANVHTN